jgi:hypothetical protein
MQKIIFVIFIFSLFCSCKCEDEPKINPIEIQILDSILKESDTIKVINTNGFENTDMISDTALYISELYKTFKSTKSKKFILTEQTITYNFLKQLKPIDLRLLMKNNKKFYSQYGHDYETWYAYQKTESKNYFSLFFILSIEGNEIIQINFSKKDTTLISIKVVASEYNTCPEYGYSYSKFNNDTLKYTDVSFYQTCSNGCQYFRDSVITLFKLDSFGKYDSIKSNNFLIKQKKPF